MIEKTVKLSDITPAEYNPRITLTEKDYQYKALKASVDEFGLVVPLVVNERTGTLISGHQRLNVMLASGIEETEAVMVDLPLEKEKALCVAMNKIDGVWDYGKLADIIEELKDSDIDTILTGFSNSEIKDLLGEYDDYSAEEHDSDSGSESSEDENEIACIVGEYKFTISKKQFYDTIVEIREAVGFAHAAVETELKRRLLL